MYSLCVIAAKALINENLGSEKMLQCAAKISIALLEIYAPDGNADTIAMDLQEYAHERQEIAKNPRHDDGWAKEFATSVDAFIAYGEKRWGC